MLGVLNSVFEHDKHDRTYTQNLRWSNHTLSDHTHFQIIQKCFANLPKTTKTS